MKAETLAAGHRLSNEIKTLEAALRKSQNIDEIRIYRLGDYTNLSAALNSQDFEEIQEMISDKIQETLRKKNEEFEKL